MKKAIETKMKEVRDPQKRKNWNYALLTALSWTLLLIIIVPFARLLSQQNEAQISIFLTTLFIICVFVGRYISGVWVSGQKTINRKLFYWLTTGIVLSAFFLFVQAQAMYDKSEAALPIAFFFASAMITIFATCLGILVKVTKYSIGQVTEAKATAAQSISELHFLQSQLSPHFLFNTLNNLYGISLSQHEKIPSMLLKLSDLLRYSVYDAKELHVPLSNEIEYIRNYIDFERLRIGDRLELDVNIEEVYGNNIKIPPLLLIVFIENAFKHSKNTLSEKIQISIMLKTFGKDILFAIKNSYDPETDAGRKDSYKGLGFENAKKRLDLLYPDKYELVISDKDNIYSVKLQIKE